MRSNHPDLFLAVDTNGRAARFLSTRATIAAAIIGLFLAVGGGTWAVLASHDPERRGAAAVEEPVFFTSSVSRESSEGFDFYEGIEPRPMDICRGRQFENCIVDGNTFWLNGVRFRLANAAVPRAEGRCMRETALGREAVETLKQLLDGRTIEIRSKGRDRQARVLAVVETPDGDVGRNLVRFGVAVPWKGREEPRETWCE